MYERPRKRWNEKAKQPKSGLDWLSSNLRLITAHLSSFSLHPKILSSASILHSTFFFASTPSFGSIHVWLLSRKHFVFGTLFMMSNSCIHATSKWLVFALFYFAQSLPHFKWMFRISDRWIALRKKAIHLYIWAVVLDHAWLLWGINDKRMNASTYA